MQVYFLFLCLLLVEPVQIGVGSVVLRHARLADARVSVHLLLSLRRWKVVRRRWSTCASLHVVTVVRHTRMSALKMRLLMLMRRKGWRVQIVKSSAVIRLHMRRWLCLAVHGSVGSCGSLRRGRTRKPLLTKISTLKLIREATAASTARRRHAAQTSSAVSVPGLALMIRLSYLVDDLAQKVGYLLLRLVQDIIEIARHIAIFLVEKRDGLARVSGAPRTAYAMHVLVNVGGQVKVDHKLDVRYVETTRGHRRRHQYGFAAAAKRAQRLLALILTLVAVYAYGRILFGNQVALEVVGAPLRLHENERERVRVGSQQVEQKRALLVLFNPLETLCNHYGCASHAAHRQKNVVCQEIAREQLYLFRKRGREHHGLASARSGHVFALDDVAYLWLEAHVEHAISFVEYQVAYVLEADFATVVQVDETTWRSD